jgi:hypothetical protein
MEGYQMRVIRVIAGNFYPNVWKMQKEIMHVNVYGLKSPRNHLHHPQGKSLPTMGGQKVDKIVDFRSGARLHHLKEPGVATVPNSVISPDWIPAHVEKRSNGEERSSRQDCLLVSCGAMIPEKVTSTGCGSCSREGGPKVQPNPAPYRAVKSIFTCGSNWEGGYSIMEYRYNGHMLFRSIVYWTCKLPAGCWLYLVAMRVLLRDAGKLEVALIKRQMELQARQKGTPRPAAKKLAAERLASIPIQKEFKNV